MNNFTGLNWQKSILNNAGAIYPFIDTFSDNYKSLKFSSIYKNRCHLNKPIELDLAGVVEKIINPYLLGNRTLVKGVSRQPWVPEIIENNSFFDLEFGYGSVLNPSPDFIFQLKELLIEEVRGYVKDRKNIGILLTGGMDSRILAGVLKIVQDEYNSSFSVVAITWGDVLSRDVIYASKIARSFNWDRVCLPITAETLNRNIDLTAKWGAEVSAFHMHAIPDVALVDGVDLIIAASYGDSIGRGEYSGVHVTKLKSLKIQNMDKFNLLNRHIKKQYSSDIFTDLTSIDKHKGGGLKSQVFEYDLQSNYMRRMLQTNFNIIAQTKPFYQFFTSPAVASLMLSLDPKIRDDRWYSKLMEILPGRLYEIPWARTGQAFNKSRKNKEDLYNTTYHSYGKWLRTDLSYRIESLPFSDRINRLGVLNEEHLKRIIKIWRKSRTNSVNQLDETLIWLASFDSFLKKYNFSYEHPKDHVKFINSIDSVKGSLYAQFYIFMRNKYRN